MSRQELKERIHELVEQVPDAFLETVKTYLTAISVEEMIPELGCSVAEYNRGLDEAMSRNGAGKGINHEEAMQAVKERLTKYRHED